MTVNVTATRARRPPTPTRSSARRPSTRSIEGRRVRHNGGMARLAHAAVVFLAVAALLAVRPAGPARAAPAPPVEDQQARELFRNAEMSFNIGKFDDALG